MLISEERPYAVVEQAEITGAKVKVIIAQAKGEKRERIELFYGSFTNDRFHRNLRLFNFG
ncbi:hypothetical protein LPY66_15085 [Dehalobacter sp. DCM]|uniref:hypothetical protein n=1 Tax=Dehalobacter sp. DCM TaxID=2907827 RepID=UPI003081E298|nr:hypothetical protein LPY66_15085 [Dehalobacter sp. DCM]